MFNSAHIHLMLNHIPVLGMPLAFVLLALALYRMDQQCTRFTYIYLVVLALLTIPAYLTGEPAEEMIEHLPGISEKLIHHHEEAAETAFILVMATGGLALLSLILAGREVVRKLAPAVLLVMALISSSALAWTATKGGEIRHPELRSDFVVQQGNGGHAE